MCAEHGWLGCRRGNVSLSILGTLRIWVSCLYCQPALSCHCLPPVIMLECSRLYPRHVTTIALQIHSDVPIDFHIPSPPLFAEQLPHSLHDAVLLGVVRVVLGRNFEQAWESLVVLVDAGSYALGDLHIVSVRLRPLSHDPSQPEHSSNVRVG